MIWFCKPNHKTHAYTIYGMYTWSAHDQDAVDDVCMYAWCMTYGIRRRGVHREEGRAPDHALTLGVNGANAHHYACIPVGVTLDCTCLVILYITGDILHRQRCRMLPTPPRPPPAAPRPIWPPPTQRQLYMYNIFIDCALPRPPHPPPAAIHI